ncbi:MAG: ATP-binding cassette domain-containing protein [Lachnospiraceae bacterium]|nr:ATP-binding cassette domain-containing protein [Lachnospiraceae bacterium]
MIDFEHISKSYPESKTIVFEDFSARVNDGEFVVVTGESGSGKSTLINMLLLDTAPDSGKIYVEERPLDRIKPEDIPEYRRKIGVIFQDFRLIADKTVYENIELARMAVGAGRKDVFLKISHVLKLLSIENLKGRYPDEISGGEQQKVCLARAIVNNPKILLCDEPTANLDPEYATDLLKLLRIINAQGITVLVASQDPIITSYEGTRHIDLLPSRSGVDVDEMYAEDFDADGRNFKAIGVLDRMEAFVEKNAPEWARHIGEDDKADDFWS